MFAKVFAGFGAELPLMTKILLSTSKFFVDWWPYLLVAVIGAIFAKGVELADTVDRAAADRGESGGESG